MNDMCELCISTRLSMAKASKDGDLGLVLALNLELIRLIGNKCVEFDSELASKTTQGLVNLIIINDIHKMQCEISDIDEKSSIIELLEELLNED
jgi:hypothetical protein